MSERDEHAVDLGMEFSMRVLSETSEKVLCSYGEKPIA